MRNAASAPIVLVVPGIMGSELSANGRRVWVSVAALARGGLARLAIDRTGVTATGLIRDAYAAFCEQLSHSHEVVPFAYDWRLPLDRAAGALRVSLDAALARAEARQQPVRIVAHSMGGLVVAALLATPAGRRTWRRACRHPGARLVMLGTPTRGSHAIAAMLIGRDALVRNLSRLDLVHDHAELLATIAAFGGVLDLLPAEGSLDLLDKGAWDRLYAADVPGGRGLFGGSVESSKSAGFAWTRPATGDLARARRARAALSAVALDGTRSIYVAGVANETPCDVVIDETAPEGRRVRVLATAHGDGRVPWSTGIPPGVPVYYLDAAHGDLANCAEAFPALLDLLDTGATSKLMTAPPRRRASVHELFELREPPVPTVLDEAEIVASAMGGTRADSPGRPGRPRVHVRIVHDNLENASSPVVVGHYEHDLIVGAEAFLDSRLSHRLSALQRMELYPGPVGTSVVVLGDEPASGERHHPGAIVAGLGLVGDLTPGTLTASLAQALTAYGAERADRERRRDGREVSATGDAIPAGLAVTALLVGSGEAGVTVADSVQALLRATAQANDRLAAAAPGSSDAGRRQSAPAIDRLDVFELYEDRAIEAVYALRQVARSTELREFLVQDVLEAGRGGRRRARVDAGSAWWQRLRVTTQPDGALRFEALTQLARANASLQPVQRRIVDAFVDAATATTTAGAALGHTLFELLVPNDFKAYAPDRRPLVLVLDPAAAALPWELLHDTHDRGARPMAVATGMIRQLLVERRRGAISRAPGNTALVVGDPIVADPRFGPLPGAAAEADAIAARLAAEGYDVTRLTRADATPVSVLSALHERPWRVLHLASHGVFEFAPGWNPAEAGSTRTDGSGPVSGLVLDGGVFLTAAEAAQMRTVPELVFVNGCYLGQTRGDAARPEAFHRLAANLATEFIAMGARAVVAAGWAVDDGAAQTFATAFYDAMFGGRAFGDAVAAARRRTYEAHGGTNTWGAYQCYGDVGFSLASVESRAAFEPPAAPSEVVAWAQEVADRARGADDDRRRALLEALRKRLVAMPTGWWRDAGVAAAVGEAIAELGEYEEALALYDVVRRAETANAPVSALEAVVALELRYADALTRSSRSRKAASLARDAEALARTLVELGSTSRRQALLERARDLRTRLARRSRPRAGEKSVGSARRERRGGRKPA